MRTLLVAELGATKLIMYGPPLDCKGEASRKRFSLPQVYPVLVEIKSPALDEMPASLSC